MGHLICVLGNKGGTGKTSITHMLSHGLGLLGKHAIAVLTDPTRAPLAREGRRYIPLDGRDPYTLQRILEKLAGKPDWIGIVDGSGGHREYDDALHTQSTLTLLPFRDSHEDMRTVRDDLERLTGSYGLPSQWPTNPWQQMAAERTLDALMQDYRPRLLDPVYSVSASKLLLEHQPPGELPTALNNVCRGLARQVLERLDEIHSEATTGQQDAPGVIPPPMQDANAGSTYLAL